MISRLPKLTSITIEDHRHSIIYQRETEDDMIKTFCQISPRINFIGLMYFIGDEYVEVSWKAASPSMIESSKDVKGEACVWTPGPFQPRRWRFWLESFGEPSAARRAMLERWPESRIPSINELIRYNQQQ
jgi:hypothetical protein